MALLEKQLEIKESSIPGAGMGLFTLHPISKGTRIVEYTGKIKTWKEVQHNHENNYIFYVTRNHIIDGSKAKKCFARYINDARGLKKIKGQNNNAAFTRDGLRVFVDATKDIEAGGEIFVAYGKEYWDVVRNNLAADRINGKKSQNKASKVERSVARKAS